ncbi:MAG TPA: phosphoribosylformylglycinamidine synthase subunit PurS [Tepidisphaeraceae bacterium]|nr:phosphoribosylformylglycinamidine synthase subunit PurS [Tepidisphaeraceae bacterium]
MIYRIDVRTTPLARGGEAAVDPLGEAIRQQIKEFSPAVGAIETSRIFLIDTAAPREQVQRVATELLADPIVEWADLVLEPPADTGRSRIEIHLKPGVMDPVAASTEMAVRDMGLDVNEVRTGRSYVICDRVDESELKHIAGRVLANGVIESVHLKPFIPKEFEHGHENRFELRRVPIRDLTEPQLAKLSREGHLFLSIPEMKAIQDYFRQQDREPTDIELETIAQTWSEHCVHKTLKSAVEIEVQDETGKVIGRRRYGNLIRDTIFLSTMELMEKARRQGGTKARSEGEGKEAPIDSRSTSSLSASSDPACLRAFVPSCLPPDFCLSVFKDNAGVIAFDEMDAVCFKVETHNHPSAIEPYGGAATGIGGCIRDVLGTGLAARPVANTNVFAVAFPDAGSSIRNPQSKIRNLPNGVIHPKRILQQVVAGVRDYGNRMGIPTVNGAVYFDDRYIGNPLVFAGCVGIIPRDKITKESKVGDAIVVMGGRTGRDGIHGATFSSAELTDTHADEFSHAVQIGNAITQKKMADVILQARDRGLFSAITDLGAGGLSSAIGEMGEKVGASVKLETVPLKYAGLRYDEIWISEAQERMALSVPQEHVAELLELAASEDVEATVIGTFGTEKQELILSHRGTEVGRMSMHFLHKGIPMPTRKAVVVERSRSTGFQPVPSMEEHGLKARATSETKNQLLTLLSHPNIASKHWIIRQYDHEVQGGSVIKPLLGPEQIGPSDAAVVRPKLSSMRGVAIACGLAPHVTDPYDMAIAAIDEAVRNAVCVGADPDQIAILDNFCWPSVDDERTMGTLVRACEACRDAALAYGIPFISGKDSLHNQFTNSETGEVVRIPNTLLISAIGVIDDVRRCVTMDLKNHNSCIVLVSAKDAGDLSILSKTHRIVAGAIRAGYVTAAHDVSDGGVPVALAEMCIASGLGVICGEDFFTSPDAFDERPGRYLLELSDPGRAEVLRASCADVADVLDLGLVQHLRKLTVTGENERVLEIGLDELTATWRGTLDW